MNELNNLIKIVTKFYILWQIVWVILLSVTAYGLYILMGELNTTMMILK